MIQAPLLDTAHSRPPEMRGGVWGSGRGLVSLTVCAGYPRPAGSLPSQALPSPGGGAAAFSWQMGACRLIYCTARFPQNAVA